MVRIEISTEQIKKAIAGLSIKERTKILEGLQRDTWEERFRQLLKRIDTRRKSHPISKKELDSIINKARKDYYDKSGDRQ